MPKTVPEPEKHGTHQIVQDEDICNGAPVVEGTRTRVLDIAIAFEYKQREPDEIVDHYPQLDLADVHAALSYYYSHIDEMKQALKRAEKEKELVADDVNRAAT